jgi:hypothetical protein
MISTTFSGSLAVWWTRSCCTVRAPPASQIVSAAAHSPPLHRQDHRTPSWRRIRSFRDARERRGGHQCPARHHARGRHHAAGRSGAAARARSRPIRVLNDLLGQFARQVHRAHRSPQQRGAYAPSQMQQYMQYQQQALLQAQAQAHYVMLHGYAPMRAYQAVRTVAGSDSGCISDLGVQHSRPKRPSKAVQVRRARRCRRLLRPHGLRQRPGSANLPRRPQSK